MTAAGVERAGQLGPAALARVGEALYGPRWQTDLARDLNLSDARRVRQWMTRARPISPGVWAELAAIAKKRRAALDQIISELAAQSD